MPLIPVTDYLIVGSHTGNGTAPITTIGIQGPASNYNSFFLNFSIGSSKSFNASAVLAASEQHTLQVIAATASSLSTLAALCAIYWFCMMRRNFRRDLVLLLITGDLWKSSWYLIFSAVSLSRGHVPSTSAFCQASGYLLQAGVISCDSAILLMSVHLHLQLFPPSSTFLANDGLYRIRRYAFAFWFILPNISASLAFIKAGSAYMNQGGFCTLPIRPFWYRLALSWIPRYLIWIYVMSVAIRIYLVVGHEFKIYGEQRSRHSTLDHPSFVTEESHEQDQSPTATLPAIVTDDEGPESDDDVAPDENRTITSRRSSRSTLGNLLHAQAMDRRMSVPAWPTTFGGRAPEVPGSLGILPSTIAKSAPSSRRGSHVRIIAQGVVAEDFAPPTPIAESGRKRVSISTNGSKRSSRAGTGSHSPAVLQPTIDLRRASVSSGPADVAARETKKRQRAIQRQLRQLFIYPLSYLIMWVMPFVAHAMNYNDHFAQHPVFPVVALNIFCQCIMGTCDVCIFCWREKPWRHIPGSPGTFFGSFLFWRYALNSDRYGGRESSDISINSLDDLPPDEKQRMDAQKGILGSLKRWSQSITGRASPMRSSQASVASTMTGNTASRPEVPKMHRRGYSGTSDAKVAAADNARKRLAMERKDFEQNQRALLERRTSVIMTLQQQAQQQAQQQDQQTQPQQQQYREQMTPGRREWWDNESVDYTDMLREEDERENGSP